MSVAYNKFQVCPISRGPSSWCMLVWNWTGAPGPKTLLFAHYSTHQKGPSVEGVGTRIGKVLDLQKGRCLAKRLCLWIFAHTSLPPPPPPQKEERAKCSDVARSMIPGCVRCPVEPRKRPQSSRSSSNMIRPRGSAALAGRTQQAMLPCLLWSWYPVWVDFKGTAKGHQPF